MIRFIPKPIQRDIKMQGDTPPWWALSPWEWIGVLMLGPMLLYWLWAALVVVLA